MQHTGLVKRSRIPVLVLLTMLLLSGVSALPGSHSRDLYIQEAPVNPAFQAMKGNLTAEPEWGITGEIRVLGYIPPPLDRSHLKGVKIPRYTARATLTAEDRSLTGGSESNSGPYPSTYDLRTLERVTPVKNQGSCGSCWAFASYGSLESALRPAELWDLSENNLKNTHGFDLAPCSGGNADMSAAYLARWSGPVDEAGDPYSASGALSPAGLLPRKHVQEISYIPARASSLDNANIKGALMEDGAVYSSLYWISSSYNSSSKSYRYSGTSSSNHAIAIVGWDDSYERSRFTPPAPGNGAFIVKNSWGSSWGSGGYFHVSYYDSRIGGDNAVFTAEDLGNYDQIYQYDPLGWTASFGFGSDTAWFGNVFTTASDEAVTAVGFYTSQVNSSFLVSLYRNPSTGPESTEGPITTVTGTLSLPGYHTILLPEQVSLREGESFSATVRLKTPGYRYPVPVEAPIAGYSSRATAGSGQSWVSSDGDLWRDLTTISSNRNVCLKVYSRLTEGIPLPGTLPLAPTPPRMVPL